MSGPLLNSNGPLIETLDKAATAVLQDGRSRTPFQPPAWTETDEGAAFLGEVGKADPLQLFDGTLQTIGDASSAFDRKELANWMVVRARTVGARQAVEEVDHYIEHDSFQAYQVMLLSGLDVESESDLGGDIRLVPFHSVPNQHLQEVLGRNYWNALPTPQLASALIRPFCQQRVHRPQAEAGERRSFPPRLPDGIQQALQDAHLCLALVRTGGCGVQAIGSTTVAGDDVPSPIGSGWRIHSYRTPGLEAPLIGIEADRAKCLHEKFLALDLVVQEHLRIPMQKVNECAASLRGVRFAIDLRVALESLFLDDSVQGELTYRLALRTAIFMGGDIERRKENQKKIKKVYGLCSEAIHNGRLSSKKANSNDFKWAQEMVCETLCRMIREGTARPDWKAMELEGGLGHCD